MQQNDIIYYFNPINQTYSNSYCEDSIFIKLKDKKELSKIPAGKMDQIIRQLGNYTAVSSVHQKSQHLTETEINECEQLEKLLQPYHLSGTIDYKIMYFPLSSKDSDRMRSILLNVRQAINSK